MAERIRQLPSKQFNAGSNPAGCASKLPPPGPSNLAPPTAPIMEWRVGMGIGLGTLLLIIIVLIILF